MRTSGLQVTEVHFFHVVTTLKNPTIPGTGAKSALMRAHIMQIAIRYYILRNSFCSLLSSPWLPIYAKLRKWVSDTKQ